MSELVHSEVIFRDMDSARRARNMISDILSSGEFNVSVYDLKNSLKGDFNEKFFVLAGVDPEIDKEFYWNTKNIKIHEKEIDGSVFYTFENPKAPDVI